MLHKYMKRLLSLSAMFFLLSSCTTKGNESIDSQETESVHTHTYSELIEEKSATCLEDGMLAHYTCLECHKFFNENKEEVNEDDLIIVAKGHQYTNLYDINETGHALKCDVCGFVDEDSREEHVYDKKIKTEEYKVSSPTCTTGSKYYYSCICGDKGEEIFEEEDALGHNPSSTWEHDETHHWHECLNGCEEKLDIAEHVFDQQVISEDYLKEAANCEHGNIFYYSCVCGVKNDQTFDDGNVSEHSGGHYDYLPFTAEHNGTSQFWQCDVCEEIFLLEDGLFSIEKVRYFDSKTLQIELPTFIDIGKDFLANDPGFNILQDGSSQTAGWFGYATSSENESTISVNFNNDSNEGDKFYLLKNSLITDVNNKQYRLDKDYRFVYQNSIWTMETIPTIPAGKWVEKGSAPIVNDDDIRSILYSFDLNDATLGYTDKNHIQESIDLELSGEDGILLDTTDLIVKRNGEPIVIGAQYFQSHILSFNLPFEDASQGDVLTIEKDSIIRMQNGDSKISRKVSSSVAYIYNGTGQWRRAKIVDFGLPSITHVQWGMVLLQDENYFNVPSDTNCYYTGSVKVNGYEYSGLPQGATLGLYFNNLTFTAGFTFEIAKGTYFDCNNILIITLKDYRVSWNGGQWSYIE